MMEQINSFIGEGIPAPVFWVFVALAIIIQGIGKSGFAGGAGVLSLPLMMLVMDVDKVAATLLPLLVLLDLNAIWHFRRDKDWSRIMQIYIPSLFGIVAGSVVWWWIGEAGIERYGGYIKQFVGVIAVVFAIYIIGKERAMNWAAHIHPRRATAWPVGVLAGFVSTIVHAAGPIVSLYMFAQGMGKTLFVGTVAWTFTLINLSKMPFYIGIGMITPDVLLFDLSVIWLVPIGSWLGKWMHDRVSESLFNRIIMVLLILAGIQLLFDFNVIHWVLKSFF